MEKRRVLITGASGLLGRALYKEFKGNLHWETMGLAFSRAKDELVKVDITDQDQIRDTIDSFKPTVIIHAAAERKPENVANNPEATRRLNVGATETISQLAASAGVTLVFISTDYVFDGVSPPFTPESTPNPLNAYGMSKLEGEKCVLSAHTGNIVLRVPILYGEVDALDESAVTVMWPKVKEMSKRFVTSDYERRYPTLCSDIAWVLRELLEKQAQDKSLSGIFHWSGGEEMTKYDMCIVMAKVFNLTTEHIERDNTPSSGATRPYNAHLNSDRLEALGISKRTPFEVGIRGCLETFL